MLRYYIWETIQLLPIFLFIRAAMLLLRRRYLARTNIYHEAGMVLMLMYVAMLIKTTTNYYMLLSGHFVMNNTYNLQPFSGISGYISSGDIQSILLNLGGNIALFMPLGFLVPLLWRGWDHISTTMIAACLSICIEVVQFYTGRSMDIDDVLLNTLGGMLGYGIYYVFSRSAPSLAARMKVSDNLQHIYMSE